MSFELTDSPNERVLNMLQSFEPLLINYIKTSPQDKEAAELALSKLRKALAEKYDELPEPKEKKAEVKEAPASMNPDLSAYYEAVRYQQQIAQLRQEDLLRQMQQQAGEAQQSLNTWDWFTRRG